MILPLRLRPLRLMAAVLSLATFSAEAVQVRIASYNVKQGFGAPGQDSYDKARDVLARVDADIVAFQEVTGTDKPNFDRMAAELGYGHTAYSTRSTFDSNLRTAFMSRFPIVATAQVQSPPGADEMTRMNIAVKVDVPGTENDPTLVTVHYKCCDTYLAESFRRAVELRRTAEFLQAGQLTAAANVFVLGDFNLVGMNRSFTEVPTANLPQSYRLGADITVSVSSPLVYSTDPNFYFASLGLARVVMRQADGVTTVTFPSSSTLDYIVTSQAVAARGYQTEIYNSAREAAYPGLPKAGAPLPAATSAQASDHLLIFGDFELDDDPTPGLLLLASPSRVREGGDDVTLTVRLPAAPGPGQGVRVRLSADDSSRLVLSAGEVVFTEGVTAMAVTASPSRDGVAGGNHVVTVTASAEGYRDGTAPIVIEDADGSFEPEGLPLFLADAPATTTSTITVPEDMNGTIAKVTVRLVIRHTWTGDLSLVLRHPDGTAVTLVHRRGGSGDHFSGTVFDDAAAVSIGSGSAPFAGTFRPETPLSILTGKPAAGEWRLEIKDNASGDTGYLDAWRMQIEFADLTAPVLTLLGENPMLLPRGGAYAEPGATAQDDRDGALPVSIAGTVNPAVAADYIVTYSATDAAGNTAQAARLVQILRPLAYSLRAVAGLDEAAADPLADPDGDGVPNLLEYALGSDPTDARSAPAAPAAVVEEGFLRLEAVVRADDPDLWIAAESSGRLGADAVWTTVGVGERAGVSQSGVPAGFIRRVWQVPVAPASPCFLRLRVTDGG